MFQQRGQLLVRRLERDETIAQNLMSGMLPKIPTQVFTCHPDTGVVAVEGVQVFEMGAHNITDIFQR